MPIAQNVTTISDTRYAIKIKNILRKSFGSCFFGEKSHKVGTIVKTLVKVVNSSEKGIGNTPKPSARIAVSPTDKTAETMSVVI